MAGGQGAAEIGAGPSRRTEELPETGEPRQLRPEPRHEVEAAETEEVVVFKPQAIRKQLQVGCSAVCASGEPRGHAGMLAMQICPCNRSQLSLAAVPST